MATPPGFTVRDRVANIRARFKRAVPATPEVAETIPTFGGGLRYGANRVTPYIAPVRGEFPSIPIKSKRFMPPSLTPGLNIRQGGTPPGPTVPQGAIHPHGSK